MKLTIEQSGYNRTIFYKLDLDEIGEILKATLHHVPSDTTFLIEVEDEIETEDASA